MPRMQFSTILSRIKSLSNITGTSYDALLKDAIQMGLDRATSIDLPYLMTDGAVTLVAPYETGTVSVTNDSKTVTGTGTSWTSAMAGRKIRIGSDNAYYRIASVTNSTSLTLETVYQGTTDTEATYSIYKDEYRLPADLDTYKIMRQIENSVAMVGLEPSAFDLYEPTPTSEGSPDFEILLGTKLDTYTTGTVSGTVSASTITGSGTSWSSVEGLGKGSRITIGSNVYTVESVDSDTQITIYETLLTTVAAGTSYSISLDNLIIQFYKIPDAVENIYFRYQRMPYPLFNDADVPDLPEKYHYILVTAGLIWAWETKDKDEAKIYEALFNSQVKEMWQRIGNISTNRVYPRMNMDKAWSLELRYPTGYSRPFSL